MTFCPSCGGHGFCLDGCQVTTPRARYWQRKAWQATVMLGQVRHPEQRAYYDEQLMKAEAVLDAEARLHRRAA